MLGLQISIKDIIDILLVALILFEAYRLLRRSGAANLFWGICAFLVAWIMVCYVFQLSLTGALFDRIISAGAIALIVIFQEEIRHFFYGIGSHIGKIQWIGNNSKGDANEQNIQEIILACQHMSASKTGALIVLKGKNELKEFADTGEIIDAAISARMIENIFFKNTPLHDGALIIEAGRLHSAACILPVSKQSDIPLHYGLRHRAALGLTEKYDALVIVVSEETGNITIAENDTLKEVSLEQLEQTLLNQSRRY